MSRLTYIYTVSLKQKQNLKTKVITVICLLLHKFAFFDWKLNFTVKDYLNLSKLLECCQITAAYINLARNYKTFKNEV